ncbi:MAG: TIGR03915 family putative DNA repair protein [Lachnospiraceae bacterium]|nr:TIGR03915 family putative DNA repair protein [Lachnospiraceae bacterium]
MRIYTCKDNYEDMMTCIYVAWEWALKNGHDNVKLMKEPVLQQSLFDEYIHVEPDNEKASKVTNSIIKKISKGAYIYVYYATLSCDDTLDDIYRFLRLGFKVGGRVTSMLTEASVIKMMESKRNVGNEIHFFREFARFNSIDGKVYVCHIEPKNNTAYMVGEHFADRMPSEYWIIVDDVRKLAVIHPKNEDMYISSLSDAEMDVLKATEIHEDSYRKLWTVFFDTIGIKQRENYKCQRNMFPLWMRKHAVEFMRE